jgi:hypothetical protein
VEILLWWLPPAVVTVVAMLWVSWLGRARDLRPDRSEAAQERFAAAILKDLPSQVARQVSAPRPLHERSTGIAVRPSQLPQRPTSDPTSDARGHARDDIRDDTVDETRWTA